MMHAEIGGSSQKTTEDPWYWNRQDFLRCSDDEKADVDKKFWIALADKNLDGKILLTSFNISVLRDYFNVTDIRQALSILEKVERIRAFSPRYLQWMQDQEKLRFTQTSTIFKLDLATLEPVESSTDQTWSLLSEPHESNYSAWLAQTPVSNGSNTRDESEKLHTAPEVDAAVSPCVEREPTTQSERLAPTPALCIEDYLLCDDMIDYKPITRIHQHRKAYTLERSYVQARLRHAFGQTISRQGPGESGDRSTWRMYTRPNDKLRLSMIAENDLAPRTEWIKDADDSSVVETELQMTDWFDRIDWESRLAKYASDVADEVLPPFGESDEDAVYDSDIMDEMDREEQDEIAALERCTTNRVLNHFEVLSTIERHKEEIQAQWAKRYLPKLERCQATLYQEHHAASRHNQADRMQTLEIQEEDLQARLIKLIDSVAQQIFYSERAVKAQSEAMRESIYQLEENSFLLMLLKGNARETDEVISDFSSSIPDELPHRVSIDIVKAADNSDLSAEQADATSCSDSWDDEHVYEDMTQPILEIDDDEASILTIASTESESAKYFSSPNSIRNRISNRYPPTSSNIMPARQPPIVLSSDSESDEAEHPVQTPRLFFRRKRNISLALPKPRSVAVPPLRPRSRVSRELKNKRGVTWTAKMTVLDPDDDFLLENVSDDETCSQVVVFRNEDSDDEVESTSPEHDGSRTDLVESHAVRSEGSSAVVTTQVDEARKTRDHNAMRAQLERDEKNTAKRKRKHINFEADTDSESTSKRRRNPRRPINENALDRRKAQEKEREEIWARAAAQHATTAIPGANCITINIGEVTDENPIFISTKVAQHLKAHQIEGVRFIWRETVMMSSVNGCLLAHSMGLGKTLQIIAFLETWGQAILENRSALPRELRRPHAMILCPASLTRNWIEEFNKWVPECSLGRLYDLMEDSENWQRVQSLQRWARKGGILILSYGIFKQLVINRGPSEPRFEEDDAVEIKSLLVSTARVVIADEAHSFKNEKSKLGRAVRLLETKARIALTGTPLANNLMEYWSIIDWLDPNFFGSKNNFRNEYLRTIEAGNQHDATKSEIRQGQKQLRVLLAVIGGKIDRRNLDCLRTLLPNKFEYVLFLKFSPVQKRLYNSFLRLFATSSQLRHPTAGLIVLIIRLRWICNHPALLRPEYTQSKEEARTLKRQTSRNDEELGSTVLTLDAIDHEERMTGDQLTCDWRERILNDSSFDLDGPDKSAKVKVMLEILKRAEKIGDKVLIFSFSLPTIQFLEQCISEHKLGPCKVITGAQHASDRVEEVKKFNNLQNYAVCLISTKAGGQGLNITGANRVILFDLEFNPTWHEQAIGRAYRMGQEKDVHVYRFQIDGSFEIKMFQQALTKLGLTSRVVDKKNIQTKLHQHEALKTHFILAPDVDRSPDKIEHLEDQLLTDVLTVCRADVLSVQKTESFHVDEENELDAADEIDILAKKEEFWREQKIRKQEKQIARKVAEASGSL